MVLGQAFTLEPQDGVGELRGPGKEGAVEGAAGLTSRRPHLVGGVGRSRSRVSVFGTALVGHGPYEDARCLGLLCCWVGDMLASERSGEASKGVLANSSNKKGGGGPWELPAQARSPHGFWQLDISPRCWGDFGHDSVPVPLLHA